MIGQFLKA